jgi:16S rRNA (cytosine967-C5)-methyltransferase
MKPSRNPRLDAVNLLIRVLPANGQGASLRAVLESADARLSAAERGLLFDLCFGVCRHYRLLSDWLDQHMQKRLKPSAQNVRLALCCGLHELWFSQRPAHAVVNAWPDVCRKLQQPWAANLANALLRKASQEDVDAWRATQPAAVATSLPDWLYQLWQQDWPRQLDAITTASLTPAPLVLRNNRLRQATAALQQQLHEASIETRPGNISEHSLYLESALPVDRIPGFHEGLCSVQDEAAQLPAELIEATAGARLLDACAAPGGKTGQLCERHPQAEVHALELDDKRLAKVGANLQRLGLTAKLLCGDAAQPATWWDGQHYDAILLDAPCSATGILRRQPDGKWHKQPQDMAQLAALQASLLEALWPLLKTGGCLVYATCSISHQENRDQITAFLARHTDARDTTPTLPANQGDGPGCQLLPTIEGWDGFYFARLEKKSP